jgi:hypothetical protein
LPAGPGLPLRKHCWDRRPERRGGVFLTEPGSTAINTTITKNEAVTDPNVHGTLG